jgi:hypothetical protein
MTSADGDTRTVWAGDAAFSYLDDQHHVIHDRASAHPDSKIKQTSGLLPNSAPVG